jgi:phospholipase/carboxylesterase
MRLISRRDFLATACGGVGVALAACRDSISPADDGAAARITAIPGMPTFDAPVGFLTLGIGNQFTGRNGRIYVPASHRHDTPAPLLILLHGAGQKSTIWQTPKLQELADGIGAVVLAPDSRYFTWDLIDAGDYAEDVQFINLAMQWTFERCRIDPGKMAIAGFSDGAGEALSLGLANGDVFDAVIGFSPGFVDDRYWRGNPRVFISHGDDDPILPFVNVRDTIVPFIRQRGRTVEWAPFDGGHTVPDETGDQAFAWLSSWVA